MDIVYISKTGGVYHTNPRCGGGSWEMEGCRRDDPRLEGRRECQRCNKTSRPPPHFATRRGVVDETKRGRGRSRAVDTRMKTLDTQFKQIDLHSSDKILEVIVPGSNLRTLLRVIAVCVCVVKPHVLGAKELGESHGQDDMESERGQEMTKHCVCVEEDELAEDPSLWNGVVGTVMIELRKNIGTTAITSEGGKEVHFPLAEKDSFFSRNAFFEKGKACIKFGLVEGQFAVFVNGNERNGKPIAVLEREISGFIRKLQRLKKLSIPI
eukprot:TRINITY_DN82276_c0_g1_i1.p1 TRINITY_DN82276_c0_g1~~TRINITY_DN82276_c0_g1_i1.p1  ORF type:complete len:288 (-),score=76.19 TRINITY_DN82276_c0_g1_i1:95-895(-)